MGWSFTTVSGLQGFLLKASEQWLQLAMSSNPQTHFRIANLGWIFDPRFFSASKRVAWMVGFLEMVLMVQEKPNQRKMLHEKNRKKPPKNTWHGLDVKQWWNFVWRRLICPKNKWRAFFKNYTELINLKDGERKKGHKKLNLQIGRIL